MRLNQYEKIDVAVKVYGSMLTLAAIYVIFSKNEAREFIFELWNLIVESWPK